MSGLGLSRDEGIRRVYMERPHVVILGAGASIASDKRDPQVSGIRLPSMENLSTLVGLDDLISKAGCDPQANFEEAYSKLCATDPKSPLIAELNNRIRDYFAKLELSTTPTIYDYLILSLRPKDLIATFNWDPFLFQAFNRNFRAMGNSVPRVSFLHGSVALGFSTEDDQAGPAGMWSKQTGSYFDPVPLLYPVTHKDYAIHGFIKKEWERLTRCLKGAYYLTFFGYSGPKSDYEAIKMMQTAWGTSDDRQYEQVEIIDIVSETQVRERWDSFICSHHYDYHTDYFDSSLAKFPRRTGEAYFHRVFPTTIEEAFQQPNPVPAKAGSLEELWEWHSKLLVAERVDAPIA